MTGYLIEKSFPTSLRPFDKDEIFAPIESWFDSLVTEFFSKDFIKPFNLDSVKSRAYPRVDIYREGKDLVLEAVVTNVNPENLKVEINKGMLILSGSVDSRQEAEGRHYYHTELFKSNFRRSFPIDKQLYDNWIKRTGGNNDIDAVLTNGVLLVHLKGIFEEDTPAVETNPTRQIDIKITDS
jgi:HSP20 family molecular chaperone IbpA